MKRHPVLFWFVVGMVSVAVLFGPWLLIRTGLVGQDELTAAVQVPLTVATAFAAGAAWRAASQSATTAKETREALGLIMEPSLSVAFSDPMIYVFTGRTKEPYGPAEVTVTNSKRWAAADVKIHVDMGDGREKRLPIDYMDPGETVVIPMDHAPEPPQLRDDSWVGTLEWHRKIAITYRDENRVCRWRQQWEGKNTVSGSGGRSAGYSETSLHRADVPIRIG